MRAALHRPQRNWGPRVREYDVGGGLCAVFLENELLRVGVLADRGTDVFELLYKPRDLDFAWLASSGVARRRRVPRLGSAGRFWTYPGGWAGVCRTAAPSSYAGARYGQHDEISSRSLGLRRRRGREEAVAALTWVTGRKSLSGW
jgi:hypothetical protein